MREGFVDTPEGQVHYVTEGSGEPLLLLHMTPRSTDQFRELMPLLAGSRRVIAMDTIGYGDSFRPQRQHYMEDYAKSVVNLLDGLGIESASILGQHTGALIGIEVAAVYPERVDKLALYGPVFINQEVGEYLRDLRIPTLKWKVKEDGSHVSDLWNGWKDQAIQQGVTDVPADILNRVVLDTLKSGETFANSAHVAVEGYTNMDQRLKLVHCSTLIIWGTCDLLILSEESRSMAGQLIPRNRAVELEGGNYLTVNLAPDKIAPLVLNFLSEPV